MSIEIKLSSKDSISKETIELTASDLIGKLDSGEINALGLLNKIKAVEKIAEAIKPKLTEMALMELSKYKEKAVLLYNSEFTSGEVGTVYDFTVCGDPKYNSLMEKFEEIKKEVKDREAFLKAIKVSETVVNEDTAEIVTVYPPLKKSTTAVKVSIK